MTKWSKHDHKWPTIGIEKMFKKSGKYRLRDCTWKLAQPWPENGPKMTNNSPEIKDYSEMLKRLFRDYFWPNRPLLRLPSLLVFITIANDLYKMLTGISAGFRTGKNIKQEVNCWP